jgi:hypothetical protein
MEPTGGVGLAVRERGGEQGWAGSGCCSVFGPRARPSWLMPLLLFCSAFFSFVFYFSDLGFKIAKLV